VDDRSGFNRYGTVPRPRPEAVHFSSSTASSISDHGFVYCDILRRDLLSAMLREKVSAAELRARAVDAMAAELLELFALGRDEADAALAPSGTDTELLAVLVAATAGKPLTNILIAPEETGRGVREAGAGQYFDGLSAAGEIIKKGAPAWPQMAVKTVEVAIRDDRGFARSGKAVFEDAARQVRDAVKQGHRVLLHVLASSKTGLSAPGEQETETLQQIAPDQIDVVVDACQLRTPFPMIGGWVRKGWMVQVSGSKFLTGPPFSGALLLPPRFRAQASGIKALLEQAPAVGGKEDWSRWWREEFAVAPSPEARSFGLIFRWLPALLEAQLFTSIPEDLRRYSFQRFRTALNERLDKSTWLVRVEAEEDVADRSRTANIATDSIVCFSVAVNHGQARRTLNEEECRLIFQLLNLDLSGKLGQLGPEENARAGLQAHIGQPVALKSQDQSSPIAILRMVLGARFFSIVAHAGPGSVEAALESEIADAIRALEKLELLASMWPRAKHILI
jgi:hypothetical protein